MKIPIEFIGTEKNPLQPIDDSPLPKFPLKLKFSETERLALESLQIRANIAGDQAKKLEAINAETLKTLKVDIEKAKELKDKIKATQADRQTKIDNILTKEQQEKFKAVQEERQAERQAKMKEAREKRMQNRNKADEKK